MKRWMLTVYAWLALGFLWLPIVVLALLSFNNSKFGAHWTGFTLKWYQALFANERVGEYLYATMFVAVVSTLASVVMGTLLAMALQRYDYKFKPFLRYLLYVPILIPDVVMGVSLLLLFNALKTVIPDVPFMKIIFGHITFQLAYVTLVVRSRLMLIDANLEEAARDLGANGWQTFWRVTFPLLLPGIASAALLAFSMSLDDYVVTSFISGSGETTLPLYIYGKVRTVVTPEINALSTLMILATVLLLWAGSTLMSKRVGGKP